MDDLERIWLGVLLAIAAAAWVFADWLVTTPHRRAAKRRREPARRGFEVIQTRGAMSDQRGR